MLIGWGWKMQDTRWMGSRYSHSWTRCVCQLGYGSASNSSAHRIHRRDAPSMPFCSHRPCFLAQSSLHSPTFRYTSDFRSDSPYSLRCTMCAFSRLPSALILTGILVQQIVTRTLLRTKGFGDTVSKSPYFAAVIVASLIYVGTTWLRLLSTGTSGPALFSWILSVS